MKNTTIRKITWEVVTTNAWGGQIKASYPTRKQARIGLKSAKFGYINGKPPSYITKVEMFRVKTIESILNSSEHVSFYAKAR